MKTFVQTVKFKAAPKDVYAIFVQPKKHSEATGAKATGAGKVGGGFTAWDEYIQGTYLVLSPGAMIVQSWRNVEFKKEDPDSILVLTFEPSAKGTTLTMTHTSVPDHQKGVEKGWDECYWTPIKAYLKKQAKPTP